MYCKSDTGNTYLRTYILTTCVLCIFSAIEVFFLLSLFIFEREIKSEVTTGCNVLVTYDPSITLTKTKY